MADAGDSKSPGGNPVRVRLSPRALGTENERQSESIPSLSSRLRVAGALRPRPPARLPASRSWLGRGLGHWGPQGHSVSSPGDDTHVLGLLFGVGFFVPRLLFFLAVLAFQLAGLSKESLRSLRLVTWALALSFVVVALLTWRYFFIAPLVLSSLVSLCLLMAAWSAARA